MSTPSLSAEGVSVRLGGRTVLDGVTLEVAPGEVVAIAGPNGAGKSTLLRVLAGLLPPGSGHAGLGGSRLAMLDRRALGRAIAYLPQERIVHWPVTAATVVGLGRLPHRAPAAAESMADRDAVSEAMAAMDVLRLAERPVSELSGGERARVLVARALAQDALYLVADEPTAGLDLAHALALFAFFRKLAGEGRAVVVALHDLTFAARFADRLVLLKDGRVAASGPPRDVLTEAALAAVYGIRATVAEIAGLPVVLARDALT
jgi:iron complex transport system ATP-binding protein